MIDQLWVTVTVLGLLANIPAAMILSWRVARVWPNARPDRCGQCGYSRRGLDVPAPCPECGLVPGAPPSKMPRSVRLSWLIGLATFILVVVAYALIVDVVLGPTDLLGTLFAAAFMQPAAAIAGVHAVLPNRRQAWISTGEAACVAWFAGLGAVVAGRIFVHLVNLDSDAQAGIALVGVSIPAGAGAGFGALAAALGAWSARASREREHASHVPPNTPDALK